MSSKSTQDITAKPELESGDETIATVLPKAKDLADNAPSDNDLMRRVAKDRDNQAYAELVTRFKRKLFATCYRMLGQAQEAEDAVQDSFIKLWNYADKWDSEKAGVGTWLYTITTNTCRDHLRKRKYNVEHDDGYLKHQVDSQQNGEAIMEYEQKADLVKQAIDALPERQKEALILSYYEGLSHNEIGEIMDATAKSIEGLVSRARNELKKTLAFMQEAM